MPRRAETGPEAEGDTFALAVVTVSGLASLGLGCPDSVALAHDPQDWTVSAVREPWVTATAFGVLPGHPWSVTLSLSAVDTFALRVWGRNRAPGQCETVVVGQTHSPFLGVVGDSVESGNNRVIELYDLRGAHVFSGTLDQARARLPSGLYFARRKCLTPGNESCIPRASKRVVLLH